MEADLQRVFVVGTSCSGKTTYAQQLSRLLGVPHLELDAVHWLPGWVPRPQEEFRALVGEVASEPAWVMDGNYGSVRDMIWSRATATIWLNYPFPLVMWRALRRTSRRAFTGELLYAGNRETIGNAFFSKDSILLWVMTTHRRRIRDYRELFDGDSFSHLDKIELTSPRDATRSLQRVASGRGAVPGPRSAR